ISLYGALSHLCLALRYLFILELLPFLIFFFFQAEHGIRVRNVTGVQTCALPIYHVILPPSQIGDKLFEVSSNDYQMVVKIILYLINIDKNGTEIPYRSPPPKAMPGQSPGRKIGRASCRDRR